MLGLINVNYVAPLDAMTSFNKYRALGIPELVWGSPNRLSKTGIPELVRGFARHVSPNQKRDPQIVYVKRGSPNWFGDLRDMYPQTKNGIPKSYIQNGIPKSYI
jgi:hypothetical protein